ncbi:hypothetical protein Bca101_000070 [Brassica carinata]
MKPEETFEQEKEDLYQTDEEDEESQAGSSVPSTPLSRNGSNNDPVSWPRSYRQSMDMLTGVTPPMRTSFVSSFHRRRQSSVSGSFTSSTSKQQLLIHKDKDEIQNNFVTSIKSFLASHLNLSVPEDLSFPQETRSCTFSQSVLNGEGCWFWRSRVLQGLLLLQVTGSRGHGFYWRNTFFSEVFSSKRCLENSPGIHTYPDIGQAAFGTTGRILVSASCVEYIIMMSDNLSGMFPNSSLYISGLSLDSKQVFAITTTLIVLPTVWLRDLSLLSYLSAGGVFSSILLALCLFWAGSVGGVGFHLSGKALDLTNLPVAIEIYGFDFGSHSVFPNIYSSMKGPSKFPLVLLISFAFCTLFYIAVAVCGYTMFGDAIQSQFTLNIPQHFTSSKIAAWTAVRSTLFFSASPLVFVTETYKKKMKQEEQEREDLYHTDDDEDEESQAHSSVPSTPLSRNDSNNDAVPWPRSYRQSMDLLTGVTPPISTNLVSSFRKRRQSSAFGSLASSSSKQSLLIDKDETQNSVVTSIKSFIDSHLKLSVPDDLSIPQENRKCTISQSLLNGINVLCGGALLTMPYALKEGGWLGLLILFSFGIITLYTGILLKRCLENSPGIHTYPDIGQAAFGTTGRILLSIFLYADLYATCVEYIIMMSDNMSGMFPNTSLYIAGISLNSNQVFAITTTLIVLPTVWLRDLSLLSYISGGVGFQLQGQVLDLTNLPVAIGIYGFGFGGHAVLPNIYSSMKEPSKFPLVLLMSFGFCTLFYIAISVCGYTMFGEAIQSQFTLNMPQHFTSSKIAVWTAVITPMTKYPLTLTPVLLSLEELLPSSSRKMKSKGVSVLIRTLLVFSTLVVALTVPFFATVAALIGSFVAMLIAVIFPCLCYLKIMKGRLTNFQMAICILIIIVGVVSGCCGTYSAIVRLIGEMT